jgi:2,5-dioxopentanoate dehydrogenase
VNSDVSGIKVSSVERAAADAHQAFRDYSRRSGSERAQFLRRIADGIEKLGDALIKSASRETALSEARLLSERSRTGLQLRVFADLAQADAWIDERIDPADVHRLPAPKPRVRSVLAPLGPVAVFGASNFPLAFSVAGGDTAAALAVGCPVIVKAHPAHPRTSQLVGDVIQESARRCHLPEGVFSLLFEGEDEIGHDVGLSLVRHPFIRAGAFTGSTRAGLALLRATFQRADPIPFFAEMGSVNPVFLFPSALGSDYVDAIVEGLVGSITGSLGQLCTKPGLLFLIESPQAQVFLEDLTRRILRTSAGTMLTLAMRSAYQAAIDERSQTAGVRTLAQVAAREAAGATLHLTHAEVFVRSATLNEEVFGPTSLAVLCRSKDELESCADALSGQLTATIWADPDELAGAKELLWTLEQKAGRIVFNGFPTGVEVSPAMMHGGPFPATTDGRFTSVGTRSILRFLRPIAWQTPT